MSAAELPDDLVADVNRRSREILFADLAKVGMEPPTDPFLRDLIELSVAAGQTGLLDAMLDRGWVPA